MVVSTIFRFLLLGSCLCATSTFSLDDEFGPVVYVNLLYRHGERTILQSFQSDPYGGLEYWPLGYGQLTNQGKVHHYELGKWFRLRYAHLIPNGEFNENVTYILSTDLSRTLESAQANSAGFFPPVGSNIWSENLLWQPIPIHTIPVSMDQTLEMTAPCKNYDRELETYMESDEYVKYYEMFNDVFEYLTNHTNQTIDTFDDLLLIHSNLVIEEMNDLKLPEWTKNVYPVRTSEGAALEMYIKTATPLLQRLKSGPVLKQMIGNMDQKVDEILGRVDPQNKTGQNISIYSAHDDTIGFLLSTMGVFDFIPPPFAATVFLELRKTDWNDFSVALLYKNTTDPNGEPSVLQLPGCAIVCPFWQFKEILDSVLPDDWEEECGNDVCTLQNDNSTELNSVGSFNELPNGTNTMIFVAVAWSTLRLFTEGA